MQIDEGVWKRLAVKNWRLLSVSLAKNARRWPLGGATCPCYFSVLSVVHVGRPIKVFFTINYREISVTVVRNWVFALWKSLLVMGNIKYQETPKYSWQLRHKRNDQTGKIILTWHGGIGDQQGRSPRARPFHCTLVGLTPAITPNVGKSSA